MKELIIYKDGKINNMSLKALIILKELFKTIKKAQQKIIKALICQIIVKI